ncbi:MULTISPECIES: hypothetical protein [Saccharothrix]|uniref:hypothetical protein n=1 Tax=Saccharothrix TaxID=2071 RepID=UPI001161509A|nr:hypothetical protein [Saccharothrix sp. CB00851]
MSDVEVSGRSALASGRWNAGETSGVGVVQDMTGDTDTTFERWPHRSMSAALDFVVGPVAAWGSLALIASFFRLGG